MKENIKIVILIIACMHAPMQAMLNPLARLRALQQTRSVRQAPKARFGLTPKQNTVQENMLDISKPESLSQKKVTPIQLNKQAKLNKLNQKKDSTRWSFNTVLSWLGMSKKTFSTRYSKENRVILTQEELLKELQKLADLDAGQEYSLQQEYQYEANNDGELQAQAWRFGRYYQEAIRNATTIAEIEMLHQAAIMWLRLQMQSGSSISIDKIKAEIARIAPKENEIVNEYDDASIPILKKYLADMKNDIYNQLRISIGSNGTGSMRDSSFARKGGKQNV